MKRPSLRAAVVALVLAGAAFAYSLLEQSFVGTPTPPAVWQRMIDPAFNALSSPTFVGFVATTAWLVYCLMDTRVTHTPPRLVRQGSHVRLLRSVAARACTALALPTVLVTIAAAVAPTLAPGGSVTGPGAGAADLLRSSGVPVGVGVVLQIALLWLFFLVVRLLVEVLTVVFSYGLAVGVGVALWMWVAASASGFLSLGAVADFRSYAFVGILVEYPQLLAVVGATYALLVAALVAAAVAADRHARLDPVRLPAWLVPCLAAFGVILLATLSLGTSSLDLFDHAVTLFYGSTGTLLQMLIELVLVVGFAFLAQFRLQRELGPWAALALIRYGSRRRHVSAVGRKLLGAAAIYSVSIPVSAVISYALAGGHDFSTAHAGTALLVYQLVVVQTLQITFYLAVIGAAMLLSDSGITGLAVTGIIAALSALPLPASALIPIQRSTTAVLFDGGWPAAVGNSLVLILATAAAYVAALSAGRARRVRLRVERTGVLPT